MKTPRKTIAGTAPIQKKWLGAMPYFAPAAAMPMISCAPRFADADDGDVVRDAEAGIPDCFHGTDRGRIVGGKHRVDLRPHRQQPLHRAIPVGFHEAATDDPVVRRFDAAGLERRAPPFLAALRM